MRLLVLLLAAVLAGCGGKDQGNAPAAAGVASVQQAFVAAAERAVPAVVNIRTVTRFAKGAAGGRWPGGSRPST